MKVINSIHFATLIIISCQHFYFISPTLIKSIVLQHLKQLNLFLTILIYFNNLQYLRTNTIPSLPPHYITHHMLHIHMYTYLTTKTQSLILNKNLIFLNIKQNCKFLITILF